MKKFIKALEDKGIMERIVDSGIFTEKMTGRPIEQGGLEMILEFEMVKDENLEDIFLQEAHAIAVNSIFKYVQKQIVERRKVEAMDNVDVDGLFAKATGKTPSKEAEQKKESNVEKLAEEFVMNAIADSIGGTLGALFKEMLAESMKENK